MMHVHMCHRAYSSLRHESLIDNDPAGFAAVELEDDEIEVKFYGINEDKPKPIYKSEFDFDEER